MTTTTTFQGMEPGAKNSSRVLRPPGGGSNISFGADEEKPPVRKDKMASSVFAEPEDPYANRRNNPPAHRNSVQLVMKELADRKETAIRKVKRSGGKPTGVLCGESSAPLRRGANPSANHSGHNLATDGENSVRDIENNAAEPEPVAEHQEEAPQAEEPAAGAPSGRRNPPGGKSSLILG